MTPAVTVEVARKVLSIVDVGLIRGVGIREPGQMCVEAAVCLALGLPHGDNPEDCVAQTLRSLKIRLNDSGWSSPSTRAKGLRRLAVAQLGSAGALDEKEFVRRVVDYAIRKSTPLALRAAASIQKDTKHKASLLDAAACCERDGTRQSALGAYAAAAAYAAYAANAAYAAANAAYAAADAAANAAADAAANAADAAAYAAYAANAANAAAARDKSLAEYAEDIVCVLIELAAPGCQWLPLTEIAA